MTSQIEKVNNYYNATVIDYKTLWTGSEDLAMHFGYYEVGIRTHKASLLKMNEVLAAYAHITKSDSILDAGCGYGGSAFWLAREIGCQVTGITVVPYQVRQAQKYAKTMGLEVKAHFQLEDFAHTSFQRNTFTVVWGLESIVHAISKKDVVKEASRVLKSKGRIIIAEYMLRDAPHLSKKEQAIIMPWLRGWAMPSLLTVKQYTQLLREAGFENIHTHDITQQAKPSLKRLGKLSAIGYPVAKILHRMKLLNTDHFGNIEASYFQKIALEKGLWKYVVITAQKN